MSEDISGAGATNSSSISLATVSLDLAMGLVSNYQLLPGVFSANTFSVGKTGLSDNLSISLSKVGGSTAPVRINLRLLVKVFAHSWKWARLSSLASYMVCPTGSAWRSIGEERPEIYQAHSLYRDWDSQRVERYVFDYLRDRGYLSAGAHFIPDGADNALSLEFRAGIFKSVEN